MAMHILSTLMHSQFYLTLLWYYPYTIFSNTINKDLVIQLNMTLLNQVLIQTKHSFKYYFQCKIDISVRWGTLSTMPWRLLSWQPAIWGTRRMCGPIMWWRNGLSCGVWHCFKRQQIFRSHYLLYSDIKQVYIFSKLHRTSYILDNQTIQWLIF